MDVSDILLAARDRLREVGWTRYHYTDADGRSCLNGILYRVMAHRPTWMFIHEVREALHEEVHERYGVYGIVAANDSHITNLDEACEVLEQAAKRAAQGKQ